MIASRPRLFSAALLAVVVAVTGCASAPVHPVAGYTPAIGEKAARTAAAMLGRPYKYQGDSPSGFDCSGLVRYSYLAAGLDVPHNTLALRSASRKVYPSELRTGDLLFFYERGRPFSHVGIYLEEGYFVHAPSSGKKVRRDSLADQYWKKSFIEARRFFE
ncbi:MAG TPA: C40 family peptidase [Nitrospirota bacterium]|nr:C40 family peptidase [Nitrospirota bacterium]